MRNHLTALLLLIVLATGCPPRQDSGMSDDGQDRSTSPGSGTSPVRFAPCNKGLPTKGMWKCDPIFADVNGDGHMDMAAIPRIGDGPHVYLGNGKGEWNDRESGLRPEQTSCGGGLSLADADGDGDLDLLVADHCLGVFVYLGDGDGHWEVVTENMYPDHLVTDPDYHDMYRGAEDLDTGDVDGDGFLDIVVGASDLGGINVYKGDGTGRNWYPSDCGLPFTQWANRVQLADINGDGALDVAAGYAEGPRAWLNDGSGNFTEYSRGLPTPSIRGLYTGLSVNDINGDGKLDLAVANWVDGPEVYFQEAGGWKKSPDVFPDLKGGAVGLAMADVDGDGDLDMAVSGRLEIAAGLTRGVFLLVGDGRGGFKYAPGSGLPETGLLFTAGLGFGDVNADRLPDLAAGSGLTVETAPGPTEPVLPAHLIFWCNLGK